MTDLAPCLASLQVSMRWARSWSVPYEPMPSSVNPMMHAGSEKLALRSKLGSKSVSFEPPSAVPLRS